MESPREIMDEWYCPNCSAIWGLEEMEDQSCFACGYPDVNEDNFPDDEDCDQEDCYDLGDDNY